MATTSTAAASAAAMMIVVVVPISAVVISLVLIVTLLLLLVVMHLLGILSVLQSVPDGGIVLAAAASSSTTTATVFHGRGHSTQYRMVQVIVERRRRVTHAGHRVPTRESTLVVHARNLRLLLVRRHSLLLLSVVLVRILLLLLVMVVVGIAYILVVAVAVMSHRGPGHANLHIPEPIVDVRFGNHVRAAVDHRAAAVRGAALVAKVWHRSSTAVRTTSSSTTTSTPSSVVTAEPRVVTTDVRWRLRRGGLLRNEYRCVCGEIVAHSRRPQRRKASFGTAMPLATSALLIHSDCPFVVAATGVSSA